MHRYKVTFKLLNSKTDTIIIKAITRTEVKDIMYTAYGDNTEILNIELQDWCI